MLPEKRYRTAIVALRHGNWEDAAHHLLTIAAEYPSYRDVDQVLTRLERTRPAAYWRAVVEVALVRNSWEHATRALERLSDLDPASAGLDDLRNRLAAQMAAPAAASAPPPPVPPASATAGPAPAAVSTPAEQAPPQPAPAAGSDLQEAPSAFRNPLFDFVSDPLPEFLPAEPESGVEPLPPSTAAAPGTSAPAPAAASGAAADGQLPPAGDAPAAPAER